MMSEMSIMAVGCMDTHSMFAKMLTFLGNKVNIA